jgi:hypothetical protein
MKEYRGYWGGRSDINLRLIPNKAEVRAFCCWLIDWWQISENLGDRMASGKGEAYPSQRSLFSATEKQNQGGFVL